MRLHAVSRASQVFLAYAVVCVDEAPRAAAAEGDSAASGDVVIWWCSFRCVRRVRFVVVALRGCAR
eukprot:2862165-Pleurochrysis_carterae.AAC.1